MDKTSHENNNLVSESKNMEDDEDLNLPADTLAILNEFLREKREHENAEQKTVDSFEENWVSGINYVNIDTT